MSNVDLTAGDDKLFEDALSGAAIEEVANTEAESEEGTKETPEAGKEGEQPSKTPEEGTAEEKQPEATVPLAVLTETRAGLQAQIDALKAQVATAPQAKPVEPTPEVLEYPDPVVDPVGFRKAVEADARRSVQNEYLGLCLDAAEARHTHDKVELASKTFVEAYNSGKIDESTYNSVVNSHNRYNAAVEWYDRQQALAAVNEIGDPVAYREKVRKELLADPEFVKSAIAGNTVNPKPVEAGLPSINKAGAAKPVASENGLQEIDDDALFSEAFKH